MRFLTRLNFEGVRFAMAGIMASADVWNEFQNLQFEEVGVLELRF